MHMHCVFFNLVGAKSRRVPLLVPTSSLSLLQWPLLYKHVAEIQLPRANEQNPADNTAQKAKHHLGNTTAVLNYSSANTYVMALRAIWQSQRQRDHLYDGTLMSWIKQNWAMTHLWNSPFSTLTPKTFAGKSESFYIFFLSSFSRKHTEKGLFFYSPSYMQ